MKRTFCFLIVLLLFPLITYADTSDVTTSVQNNVSEEIESPETGVNDYFVVLGSIMLVITIALYIVNKKNLFQGL